MDILEDQLAIVRGNWGPTHPDEPFSFDGEHYVLRGLDARPKPIERRGGGRIPLIMGGNAAPRGCRLAARYADEYNTTSVSDLDELGARKARLDAACARAGRAPIPFSSMTTVLVGTNRADLAERAARVEERDELPRGSWLADPPANAIVGTVEEVIEELRALADLGLARVMCRNLIPDDLDHIALLGDTIAPVLS
jgi:alkanesulfonate monooxygenase SsuD/methylene tetrahydromethanopterin reductase-like flavin-dependent oxidoreductase (luciferase family)